MAPLTVPTSCKLPLRVKDTNVMFSLLREETNVECIDWPLGMALQTLYDRVMENEYHSPSK